jgi:plastocyanin
LEEIRAHHRQTDIGHRPCRLLRQTHRDNAASSDTDWRRRDHHGSDIEVCLEPEQIRLKAGVPIRLRLDNESDGGHTFSAPTFFAASSFRPGSSFPSNDTVEVGSHQTVEIALVPGTPAAYPLECTHFLHSAFGMNGTVEVTP